MQEREPKHAQMCADGVGHRTRRESPLEQRLSDALENFISEGLGKYIGLLCLGVNPNNLDPVTKIEPAIGS